MSNNIDIVIGAQDRASSVLSSVMNKAGGLASSFAAVGPAMVGVGAAVAGAAAGFVALGASISAAVSAANEIDALSDKARALGESVGSLQEFQFALAEAGNIDASTAIATLEKLSATVGKIAAGNDKEGSKAFKQLGLDAKELSVEGPIAQFEAIQNKLAEVGNNSQRAAIAQQLFGKAAKDLLPALSVQAATMKESMEYARKVGAAVSDEGAAGVAAMNDAIGRAQLGFKGLSNTLAVTLAPAIEQAAISLASWIPPLVHIGNDVLPRVVDGFAYVADAAREAASILPFVDRAEKTWAASIEESRAAAEKRSAEFRNMLAVMKAFQDMPEEDGKFDALIEQLERQLQVAIHGEEAVKAQEQVLIGRNELEQERIRLLQEQVKEQLNFNEARKVKEEESKKAEKEREASMAKLANVPKSSAAFESRVMTRGPVNDPMLTELRKNNEELKKANRTLEETYEQAKQRGQVLEVEVVK